MIHPIRSLFTVSFLVLMVLVPGTFYGQSSEEGNPKVTVAARAGVSMSSFTGDTDGFDDSRIGLANLGLSATLPLTDKLACNLTEPIRAKVPLQVMVVKN